MIQEMAGLISNREIAADYFEMTLSVRPELTPLPGQFCTLRVNNGYTPLLRRPFAFSSHEPGRSRIIYQRRGAGTELLAGKREGDVVDIIAPLGNSWPLPAEGETAILVAGGIGIGPILFLAHKLTRNARPFRLIIGARSAQYIPLDELLQGLDPEFTTDDGSAGTRGTVVAALPASRTKPLRFYACGPRIMMQAVHRRAVELDSPCHVSMEQTIGCGVGACMGCVIRLTGEERYARVCADGPIFNSQDIAWS